MKRLKRVAVWLAAPTLGLGLLSAQVAQAVTALRVSDVPSSGSFPLVAGGHAADLLIDARDARVVRIAAEAFAEDVERVTGQKPRIGTDATQAKAALVIVGTLGQSGPIGMLNPVQEGSDKFG